MEHTPLKKGRNTTDNIYTCLSRVIMTAILYLRWMQACLERPVPPNLIMSLQAVHFPQSGCWQTWVEQRWGHHMRRDGSYQHWHNHDWKESERLKIAHTSHTPHLLLRGALLGLLSIWFWKNVSKTLRTRGVVVAWGQGNISGYTFHWQRKHSWSAPHHRVFWLLLLFFNLSGSPGCLPTTQGQEGD